MPKIFKAINEHPIWLVGFRPFFVLAFIAGALLPLSWVGIFSGAISPAGLLLPPLQWHTHEMFYAFGWAVMAGFLLTASKNWVKIRGLHAWPLMVAVGLWIFERFAVAGFLPDSALSSPLRFVSLNGSVIFVALYVTYCLVRYREMDTFKDNYFFVIGLPLFLLAKALLISESHYHHGLNLTLGLFRLAFVVMFERTMTQFMQSSEGVRLVRNSLLDSSIKFSVLLSALSTWLPERIATLALGLAAILLSIRFILWNPARGFRKFQNATMYTGYFALTIHLYMEALISSGAEIPRSTSIHTFTFLCMGIVIPSMLLRISQGHTGRPIQFTATDKLGISSVFVGALFRLVLPILIPQSYFLWLAIAGFGWLVCFATIGVRVVPFLFAPRADGKLH